jgi:O-antigen/teichoic acid export membrane protein
MVVNLAARVWIAAIGIILIPQYIKLIGIESYGLIGFYSTILGTITLLDFGLTTTLNRELAKAKAVGKSPNEVRNLVFTFECIYWTIGLAIAIFIISASSYISSNWVNVEKLSIRDVRTALILMAAVIAFQWPIGLYNGGLMGLERIIPDNIIMVVMSTVRSVGVILVLLYYSASIQAFFVWQAITSLIYVLLMRRTLWSYLPSSSLRAKFSKIELRSVWKFAAGMTGISIVTFFLMQLDKIVVSKLVSLSEFGYYTLSFTVASSIGIVSSPISTSIFPRLTSLVSSQRNDEFIQMFHKSCKTMTAVVFPVGLTLIFFSQDILMFWTKNVTTVSNTYLMVCILVAGTLFNCLMMVPYFVMLANGTTRFVIIEASIASFLLLFFLLYCVNRFGVIGATFGWLATNFFRFAISTPILLSRYFLRKEIFKWLLKDVIFFICPSLILLLIGKSVAWVIYPNSQVNIIFIAFLGGISFAASLMFLPAIQEIIKKFLFQKKNYVRV